MGKREEGRREIRKGDGEKEHMKGRRRVGRSKKVG